jgi:hypothetical protein
MSYKNNSIQFFLVSFSLIICLLTFNACTVKHAPVEHGTIPRLAAPTPAAEEFGKTLFADLKSGYKLDAENQKQDELAEIFNHLAQAAGADKLPWHMYLLDGPEIVDVRAVHGNYIFTNYSPQALVDLWKRIAEEESLQAQFERISRSLSPQDRVTMLETLILELPEGNKQLAKKQVQ